MRLAVVGSFSRLPDEGMVRTAHAIAEALERIVPTAQVDLDKIQQRATWTGLRKAERTWLIYIPGPSWISLALLRVLASVARAAGTACLTLNPERTGPDWYIRRLAPDVAFVHSQATTLRFEALGIRCVPLDLGIDPTRFCPVDSARKQVLRKDLGWPLDQQVVLHVGHLKKDRNIDALGALSSDAYVVVVGSTATRAEQETVRRIQGLGIHVESGFQPAIEHFYQAADCYVFPTTEVHNATEIPLSILEAAACGIPVVSTDYGGVGDRLSNVPGIHVTDDIASTTRRLLATGSEAPGLRSSWDDVARRIVVALEAEEATK